MGLTEVGTLIAILVSFYTLYEKYKEKPDIAIQLLSSESSSIDATLVLSFQNSGKAMTSATKYILKNNERTYYAYQEVKPISDIPSGPVVSVLAYPLELPPGKACHFSLIFKVQEKLVDATLEIYFINHETLKVRVS